MLKLFDPVKSNLKAIQNTGKRKLFSVTPVHLEVLGGEMVIIGKYVVDLVFDPRLTKDDEDLLWEFVASCWPHKVDPEYLKRSYTEILRRLIAGPKNSSTSAALFDVREELQPQPFLKTALGRLWAEVHAKIYCYLIVACPQSQTWIESPFCSRKDREENFKDVFESSLFSTKRKADTDVAGPRATFGKSAMEPTPPDFVHLRSLGLALLRVCRQIYSEAYPAFYGSKRFYFANAQELLTYLNAVDPLRRIELETIRIGKFFSRTPTMKMETDNPYEQIHNAFGSNGAKRLIVQAEMDAHAMRTFTLLARRKSLSRIYLDMKQGEEGLYLCLLVFFSRARNTQHLPLDLHHWVQKLIPSGENFTTRIPSASGPRVRTLGPRFRTTGPREGRVTDILTAAQTRSAARTTSSQQAEALWKSPLQNQLEWANIFRQLREKGKWMGSSISVEVDILPPPPFYNTALGQQPLEVREDINRRLLTTAVAHVNLQLLPQSDQSEAPKATRQTISASKFIHLGSSDLRIIRTCRQVYYELRRLIHAQNSYFVASGKELSNFIHSSKSCRSTLCGNSVTFLAVKDLVRRHDLLGMLQYELDFLAILVCVDMRALRNLRTIGLYIRAGQEKEYVKLLLRLPGMERGVVEFQSGSRWKVRPQRDDEEWKLQDARSCTDLNGQRISDAELGFQRQQLSLNCRQLRLEEGEERFVEVEIERASEEEPAAGNAASDGELWSLQGKLITNRLMETPSHLVFSTICFSTV